MTELVFLQSPDGLLILQALGLENLCSGPKRPQLLLLELLLVAEELDQRQRTRNSPQIALLTLTPIKRPLRPLLQPWSEGSPTVTFSSEANGSVAIRRRIPRKCLLQIILESCLSASSHILHIEVIIPAISSELLGIPLSSSSNKAKFHRDTKKVVVGNLKWLSFGLHFQSCCVVRLQLCRRKLLQ